MSFITNSKKFLSTAVDGHTLGLFRIVYGLFMAYEMSYYMKIGLVKNMFVLPKVNFHYDYLYWLKPLSEPVMNVLLFALFAAALLIAAGVWMRWACRFLALGYAYIFLIDKSIYNNHIYLFILLAVLLSLTDADRFLSMNKGRLKDNLVQRWQVFILQAQIVIVYFYGGITKMSSDWIVNKQPATTLLNDLPVDHIFAPLLKNDFGINMLTYGGFLLDILAPLLLWYKPARRYGLFAFIAFNAMNSVIFNDIGIFPYVMLGTLFIFYKTEDLPVLKKLVQPAVSVAADSKKKGMQTAAQWSVEHSMPVIFLTGYFAFQLLFPLRGHFLPNPLDYTTIGNRFSWRMKVDTRLPEKFEINAVNPINGQVIPIQINTWINEVQIKTLLSDPRALVDFAQMIKREMALKSIPNGIVHANIQVKYNGRPAVYFVDPATDLTTVKVNPFEPIPWLKHENF